MTEYSLLCDVLQEGTACGDHGIVTCALCLHHSKDNNFTGGGYRSVLQHLTLTFIESSVK